MKLKINIDPGCEEEIIVFARERTRLIDGIERLVSDAEFELWGHNGKCAVLIDTADVFCFISEGGRVYALTNERLLLKTRLYLIEEHLGNDFIKINQSCIANIKKIDRFDASVSGSVRVTFKNGYCDYVSRRQLKNIKERLGL